MPRITRWRGKSGGGARKLFDGGSFSPQHERAATSDALHNGRLVAWGSEIENGFGLANTFGRRRMGLRSFSTAGPKSSFVSAENPNPDLGPWRRGASRARRTTHFPPSKRNMRERSPIGPRSRKKLLPGAGRQPRAGENSGPAPVVYCHPKRSEPARYRS